MPSNLDRYKADLDSLIMRGGQLLNAIQLECFPERFKSQLKAKLDTKEVKTFLDLVPNFKEKYQEWYSEAKALIRQLLPDRLLDFVRHYEKPKSRKNISFENYTIEDHLQGLTVTRGYEKERVVGPEAAIPHFQQQLAILGSAKIRFESSLFDIRQLVQADVFDSELEAAEELAKHKFGRAAGAIAGVVLERHLRQVCDNHGITVTKKNAGISDLNDALKSAGAIEIPQWRFLQHLADLRNQCDHSRASDPTIESVSDLVSGVTKITKTLF
jgi:hypothetical protein